MSAIDPRPMPKPSPYLQQAVSDLDALIARAEAARMGTCSEYAGPERRKWRAVRKVEASKPQGSRLARIAFGVYAAIVLIAFAAVCIYPPVVRLVAQWVSA